MNVFDRTYARGPWRVLPVPAHLADRRAGLTFQLGWTGGLAVLLALAAWIGRAQLPDALVAPALPLVLTAIGAAAVFARGGFDLSVGAISSLAAILAVKTGNPWLGLAAALACGLANGALVAILRVPGWLVTSFTVLVVNGVNAGILREIRLLRPADPSAMDWALTAAPIVAIAAAVVAFVWAQLLPGAAAGGRLRRMVEDAVLPYVFSAGLAAMAGFTMAARIGAAGTGPSQWMDVGLAVVLGGTFLGAGRANVVGVAVAALGVGALQTAFITRVEPGAAGMIFEALFLVALAVNAGAHALAARRFAKAHPAAEPPPAPPAPDRPRLYERGLFHGPGRIVPVPAYLSERRSALRVELVWTAVLVLAFAVFLVPASRGQGWASFSFYGPQLVIPMFLALGASAVVARGGFDFSAVVVVGLAAQLGALRGEPWLALAAAIAVGLLNGGLVALLRVPGWIATFATAFVVQLAGGKHLVESIRLWQLSDEAMRWVPAAAVCALVLAAAGAFVWLQLLPGRAPAGPVRRWRERLADGAPYLFSSVLAGIAGVYHLSRITRLEGQLTFGDDGLIALVVAGCWLGAGRANVLGVVVAVVGLVLTGFGVMVKHPGPAFALSVMAGAALVALAASRVVHPWVGKAHALRAPRAEPAAPELAP